MQVQDLFWKYFAETGRIGAYLIYKKLKEEDNLFQVPFQEEKLK